MIMQIMDTLNKNKECALIMYRVNVDNIVQFNSKITSQIIANKLFHNDLI